MSRRALASRLAPLALAFAATLAAPAAFAQQGAPPAATAAPAGSADPDAVAEKDLPPYVREILKINWQRGPGTGQIGDLAEIKIPEDFVFADGAGTRRFLELNENPTGDSELGMIGPADLSWVVTFEFSDIGYVKDDEKAALDADEMLKSLRESNQQGNEVRKQRGWATLSLDGWAQPPRYEPTTHNLEWATRFKNERTGHLAINHNIRLLGREGVMEATLLCSTEKYAESLVEGRKVLDSYSFKQGKRYSEWKPGERIAEVGLVGLVTGGAIAAAAKTGVLGKLGKGVVKLVAAAGAAIAAAFGKLFKRKDNQAE